MPKFQNIMQQLHPKVIIEKCLLPSDTARGKYVLKSSIVKSSHEFEKEVLDYARFHFKEIMNFLPPPDFAFSKARNFLDQTLGYDNAVFIGLSGAEGGMPLVLTHIAEGFKQEAKKNYYDFIMTTYIDSLDFNEIADLMREFKSKLSAYSPALNFISPEQMVVNYKETIFNYIESLTKLKNLWSY